MIRSSCGCGRESAPWVSHASARESGPDSGGKGARSFWHAQALQISPLGTSDRRVTPLTRGTMTFGKKAVLTTGENWTLLTKKSRIRESSTPASDGSKVLGARPNLKRSKVTKIRASPTGGVMAVGSRDSSSSNLRRNRTGSKYRMPHLSENREDINKGSAHRSS